jgi:hypothetical protein
VTRFEHLSAGGSGWLREITIPNPFGGLPEGSGRCCWSSEPGHTQSRSRAGFPCPREHECGSRAARRDAPARRHERVSRAAPTRSTGGRLALPVRPARDSLGGDCRNSSERKPARPPTRVSLLSNLRSPSRIPPGFCIPGKRPCQPRTRRRPAGPSQLRLVTRLRFAWCGLKCGLNYGLNYGL